MAWCEHQAQRDADDKTFLARHSKREWGGRHQSGVKGRLKRRYCRVRTLDLRRAPSRRPSRGLVGDAWGHPARRPGPPSTRSEGVPKNLEQLEQRQALDVHRLADRWDLDACLAPLVILL